MGGTRKKREGPGVPISVPALGHMLNEAPSMRKLREFRKGNEAAKKRGSHEGQKFLDVSYTATLNKVRTAR